MSSVKSSGKPNQSPASRGIELALVALFATFDREPTDDLVRGYMMGLSGMTVEQIQTAVRRSIMELKFLPKPAELRELGGAEKHGEARAMAAWMDVLKALRKGPYCHINFQDALCNAVVRNMGGWPSFCSRFSDAESEKWTRLEFIKCYQAYAGTCVNGEAIEPLKGISQVEIRRGANGEIVKGEPTPVLIECDSDRAKLPCPIKSPNAIAASIVKAIP
jgi:hypothetical protein